MTAAFAIFKREVKSYFVSPVAYVFLCLFLALSAFFTFNRMFQSQIASLSELFSWLPWLFIGFAPAIAMGMWSNERQKGTVELLFTLPVTIPQAILGKFLAAWLFFGIALALTWPIYLTVWWLGEPEFGPVFSGYLGAFLMAGGYLAISCFFSVITKNQVISLILSMVACFLFVMVGSPAALSYLADAFPEGLVKFIETLSFLTHYDVMQRGIIELRNILFLLVIPAGFIAASCVMLNNRKAH